MTQNYRCATLVRDLPTFILVCAVVSLLTVQEVNHFDATMVLRISNDAVPFLLHAVLLARLAW